MTQEFGDVHDLRAILREGTNAVVFTGAGISTESGIPDFRSPNGIWSKYKPIYFQDFVESDEAQRETWRRKFITDKEMSQAEPNIGHRAVATLCHQGVVNQVITQNVDGLHQASGVPDGQVIELHGNATYAKCLVCGTRHEIAPIKLKFEADGSLPACMFCGGLIKTATISFGQPMPETAMRQAEAAALASDLFVVIGSSLVVYPAAGFPAMAKENGAKLVILNREPTDMDTIADLVINAEIGPTLGPAVGMN
ncbi:MAG: SIR2 family NAD-dependent protein deacylase [Alphaproteobacteria bacterium]